MRPRVYFDICALKREWDDASQLRVRLEADAVTRLLQLARSGGLVMIHSAVHDAENAGNPNPNRRAAVEELLETIPLQPLDLEEFRDRVDQLERAGITGPDAGHLAAAVMLGADAFVTTDDRLRSRAGRARLSLRVVGPIEFASEVVR